MQAWLCHQSNFLWPKLNNFGNILNNLWTLPNPMQIVHDSAYNLLKLCKRRLSSERNNMHEKTCGGSSCKIRLQLYPVPELRSDWNYHKLPLNKHSGQVYHYLCFLRVSKLGYRCLTDNNRSRNLVFVNFFFYLKQWVGYSCNFQLSGHLHWRPIACFWVSKEKPSRNDRGNRRGKRCFCSPCVPGFILPVQAKQKQQNRLVT